MAKHKGFAGKRYWRWLGDLHGRSERHHSYTQWSAAVTKGCSARVNVLRFKYAYGLGWHHSYRNSRFNNHV